MKNLKLILINILALFSGLVMANPHYSQDEINSISEEIVRLLITPDIQDDLQVLSEGILNDLEDISEDNSFGFFSALVQNQEQRFDILLEDVFNQVTHLSEERGESFKITPSEFQNRFSIFQEALDQKVKTIQNEIRRQRLLVSGLLITGAYVIFRRQFTIHTYKSVGRQTHYNSIERNTLFSDYILASRKSADISQVAKIPRGWKVSSSSEFQFIRNTHGGQVDELLEISQRWLQVSNLRILIESAAVNTAAFTGFTVFDELIDDE